MEKTYPSSETCAFSTRREVVSNPSTRDSFESSDSLVARSLRRRGPPKPPISCTRKSGSSSVDLDQESTRVSAVQPLIDISLPTWAASGDWETRGSVHGSSRSSDFISGPSSPRRRVSSPPKKGGCKTRYECGEILSTLPSGAIPISQSECSEGTYLESSPESSETPMSLSECPRRRRCRPFHCDDPCSRMSRCGFQALVVPMTNLQNRNHQTGMVSFLCRRKNATVTFQWESFSGDIGANGVSHVSVNQTIADLPPYPVQYPIRLLYKSTPVIGYLSINPSSGEQISFFFNVNGSGEGVQIGDHLEIPASTVTWIVE